MVRAHGLGMTERQRAENMIAEVGGAQNLSRTNLEAVCRLLYVGYLGSDELLLGNINSKLYATHTIPEGQRPLDPRFVDALGKR